MNNLQNTLMTLYPADRRAMNKGSFIKNSFIIYFLISSNISSASSVDNLTVNLITRNNPLTDSTNKLNTFTNFLLKQSILLTNAQSYQKSDHKCNYERLYLNIKNGLGGGLAGKLQKFVDTSDTLDKSCLDVTQTYYRDYWSKYFIYPACVVQINNINIGSDKLGHFFDQGYELFKISYLKHGGMLKAFQKSLFQEKTYFGGLVSGIMSYADMIANFQGMRFYASLMGNYQDILRKEISPIIACTNGFFEQVKSFDWRDYVDHGLSEAYNCSKFFTNTQYYGALKHAAKMKILLKINEDEVFFRCSTGTQDNISKNLNKKYKIYEQYLLNNKWGIMEF